MIRKVFALALPIVFLGLSTGCPYSFTGASVASHLKTIAIPLFDDQSGLGEAGLREQFTTALTNLFINDNSLQIADKSGSDSILEGVIESVADAPLVVSQGENVSQRRITLTVKCTYQDKIKRKKVWERSFSQTGDYDSGGGLSQRDAGLREAIRKVTEDILLETVSGW
jgi:hypothetical protein